MFVVDDDYDHILIGNNDVLPLTVFTEICWPMKVLSVSLKFLILNPDKDDKDESWNVSPMAKFFFNQDFKGCFKSQ